jgi:hypothetical protein
MCFINKNRNDTKPGSPNEFSKFRDSGKFGQIPGNDVEKR